MNIAVCDDDANELKALHEMIDKWAKEQNKIVKVYEFQQGELLCNTICDGKKYDMFILDVMMPEMDGITLAKKLREARSLAEKTPIIFLTSTREYAVESYKVRAFHYLVKPVDYGEFADVLNEASGSIQKRMDDVFFVRTRDGDYYVSRQEINCIIFEKRCICFICNEKKLSSLTISESFKSATAEFDTDGRFFRCGASIIVNLSAIRAVEKNIVTFANNSELTVPRTVSKELYQAWIDYFLD
ncbi:MAG: response regulator transcription factor [Lachnospiraceae bacterium]|nr:response regulator transcription factor [Lachnospiraceae bacterium]